MKKILSLILLLVMIVSLCACGKVEITMQEIYDAGQTEAMLKNHESAYIRDELDGEFFGVKYLTKDYAFDYVYDAEYEWAEFMTDDKSYYYIDGDYVRYLPITPDGLQDGFTSILEERYASVIFSADTVDEIIESVNKKGGRITVTSILSQKIIDSMADYGITGGDFEYVLDAKTREIIHITGDYALNDGTTYSMASEISYDAEAPEMVKTFLEYTNRTENLRTITVVSNPGTDKEVSQSIQTPKGLVIGFRYDEDFAYEFELYTDAACTELYDPYEDAESDLTVYVAWKE